ncbi:DUF1178 family protein [Parerythrobacter jejuensis]|uniref:DUF1178 family protein n=1 Tax=Parerythrobacter jejuensis TaxID=795812 RepID=A0A845AQ46_9SPHN|nr:DUF1178 family protein [Parerythrobacter jejuensis]MXP32420.1 DUF1178 family protein [Parerythrobacter jejuensis]
MIVFDLSCSQSHRFEGWFGSTNDYEGQRERGLLTCPECGCDQVGKAPMAPAVPAKSNAKTPAALPSAAEETAVADTDPVSGGGEESLPPKLVEAMKALAKVQAETIKDSTWVGEDFAKQSREMHYGDRDEKLIHGKATSDEAKELLEEGITVSPLLIPVAPPDELN